MKITDYYCDRCGKPMVYTHIAFIKTYTGIKTRKDYDYEFSNSDKELCPDCFDSFKEWWSKGKEIEK